MDNLTATGINCHVTGIADDITGLCILKSVYRTSHTSVR